MGVLHIFEWRDNVTWDEEQEEQARLKVQENSEVLASGEQILKYENEAEKFWDKFYGIHNNRYSIWKNIDRGIGLDKEK